MLDVWVAGALGRQASDHVIALGELANLSALDP